jgi:primosomal replication protein N
MTIRAVAIGGITRKIAALALGQVASYAGFIAPSRNAKGLVFHVTDVDA